MSYAFKDLHWSKGIEVKEYLLPNSLADALDNLEKYQGRAQVIAGGTDVVPQLRHRDLEVDALVDITRLPDMDRIEEEGDMIQLGGLVTHAQVASSLLIREKAGILAEGARSLGSPQIRSIATVAGNLISAHPAADTAMPLLALNASVVVTSKEGSRAIPLADLFSNNGAATLDSRKDILTHIRFPSVRKDQGGCHLRLSKRRSITIAVLIFAAVVKVDKIGQVIKEATVALGPVAPKPFRAVKTETLLKGASINMDTIEKAANAAFEESQPISDAVWGSEEYKREMVRVLTRRGLKKALERAGTPIT
ncbi:MAG: xanthine dehydrogenase family protein subunit M [Deltaproteobacteria bacterium]|nr:xanthine dehydrogenase family protein subunit M [Deltaproteobacteria bacterium]